MKRNPLVSVLCLFVAALLVTVPISSWGAVFPLSVTDAYQNRLHIPEKPQRVVSLAPYITEMLVAFGQEQALVGMVREDLILNSGLRKKDVGGYFSPDIAAIADCQPDLIIAASCHKAVIRHFQGHRCPVMVMEAGKIAEAFSQMAVIGQLFDCESRAQAVIQANRDKLTLVKSRLEGMPGEKRKRVIRVMAGDDILSCPGDDSFQNEMIRAAGGVTSHWGRNGFAVPVTVEEWQDFNPQVIYGCNRNEAAVRSLLGRDEWKAVDAVRDGAVTMFPCDLTCQVSTRTGDFVQWLAAVLYPETFADSMKAIMPDAVLGKVPLALDFDYVRQAEIVRHRVADAEYKSLVVCFKKPTDVISTFEGPLSEISAVGNTYVPMHASLGHMAFGVEPAQAAVRKNLGLSEGQFAALMTGAHMDNLAVGEARWKNLKAVALVTAGVKGNAMRMSRDTGSYYSHGTINIIILTNHHLSAAAMARAIVTVTEAKSAALLDMDIRSTYLPLDYKATGTGTDNIIVVQGEGPDIPLGGGHTKIGELIAKAVHAGVTEAICKQNGIKPDRSVFQRLADRHLSLAQVVDRYPVTVDKRALTEKLAGVLQKAEYAALLESALAISDEYQKGLITNLGFFDELCCLTAAKLSGRTKVTLAEIPVAGTLPIVVDRAFGAVIAGITLQK